MSELKNKKVKSTIDIEIIQIDIISLKMRESTPLNELISVGNTPKPTSYFIKFLTHVDPLFNPFRKYNHWAKYGFTFDQMLNNEPVTYEIAITWDQLEYTIKTTKAPQKYTVLFKRREVHEGTKRLDETQSETILKTIMKKIDESQSLERKPFYEEKENE